jgi:hypothetical protein
MWQAGAIPLLQISNNGFFRLPCPAHGVYKLIDCSTVLPQSSRAKNLNFIRTHDRTHRSPFRHGSRRFVSHELWGKPGSRGAAEVQNPADAGRAA